MLVNLLDPEIPAIAGSELNEDPFLPITKYGRRVLAEKGDAAPLAWIPREERYREKLATPDVTIADLIGDIDPIKAATERRTATKRLGFAARDSGSVPASPVPSSPPGIPGDLR